MITKETLDDFFENTRKLIDEGRAPFDIDAKCKWSYFFVDTSKEKLTQIGRHLETEGYEIIGFLEPSPEDDDQETIYLRFDQIETHTAESLFELNHYFYCLAEKFDVRDYDGMDVGAIDGP
jgi:hypothetical protein